MSSEFRSKAWRVLSDALGMNDQKAISRRVSNDPITPVVSLDLGMQGYQIVTAFQEGEIGPPDITTFSWALVGGAGSSNPPTLPKLVSNTADVETLIMGWRIDIGMNSIADAANGKFVNYDRVHVLGQSPTDTTIQTSHLEGYGYYDWASGRRHVIITSAPNSVNRDSGIVIHQEDKPIWVPAGTSMTMFCYLSALANYNANANYRVEAWGVTVPKGIRPPFL